jgi:WD40 repeat protein
VTYPAKRSYRDLQTLSSDSTLSIKLTGVVSGHTRPVDCLAYDPVQRLLYTGDSMGVIKAWELDISEDRSHSRATQVAELKGHRTGVNDLSIHEGSVWSGKCLIPHPMGSQLTRALLDSIY